MSSTDEDYITEDDTESNVSLADSSSSLDFEYIDSNIYALGRDPQSLVSLKNSLEELSNNNLMSYT